MQSRQRSWAVVEGNIASYNECSKLVSECSISGGVPAPRREGSFTKNCKAHGEEGGQVFTTTVKAHERRFTSCNNIMMPQHANTKKSCQVLSPRIRTENRAVLGM
jgi:hypothetical protein